jgi:hypothetical protein
VTKLSGWDERLKHISWHWDKGKQKESWFRRTGVGRLGFSVPESHNLAAMEALRYQVAASERRDSEAVETPLDQDGTSMRHNRATIKGLHHQPCTNEREDG